jgi:hypothetical protein
MVKSLPQNILWPISVFNSIGILNVFESTIVRNFSLEVYYFNPLGDKGQTTNFVKAKYSYSETQNKPKTF